MTHKKAREHPSASGAFVTGSLVETGGELFTDEKWQAIIASDASYDDKFLYAVQTTGIFCRPSCKSRAPNKENVRLFSNAEQALGAHFRPCKRCKPTGQRSPINEWVTQIKEYIDTNYNESLSLDHLAYMCHGSPYHLHRTFKRITGITPVEYIQETRINRTKEYLIDSEKTVADIGLIVGIPNTPYFITLFKKITGHTPTSYRKLYGSNHTKEVLHSGINS